MGDLRTRGRGLGFLMAAGLVLGVAAPAVAAGDAIDQSQQVATSLNSLSSPMAQTFTAGSNGQLDRVSLMVATTSGAVATASTVVTANEGSVVSNSGTYSDPDGDNVSLTASTGNLTKTGSASGTWTWTTPSTDESPVQTVSVTASDGKGGIASVSFTFTVVPVPPTVTITGAQVSGPEGTAIALTGKATSPSPADNAAGFTLNWTATKNGQPYAKGTGTSLSITPDDEGTFAVTLQAIDDGGNSATA